MEDKISYIEKTRRKISNKLSEKGCIQLTPYISSKIRISFQCKNEQHPICSFLPGNILLGVGCIYCGPTYQEAAHRLTEFVTSKGGEIVSAYLGNKRKIKIKCEHGKIFESWPGNIRYKGSWCDCKLQTIKKRIVREIDQIIAKKKEKRLTSYVNLKTKITFSCRSHGEWSLEPTYVLRGRWCPECSAKSMGESELRHILEEMDIEYISEYKTSYLPRKRYDFRFKYNGIKYLCEYDGQQHFRNNGFYSTSDNFSYHRDIDKLKTLVGLRLGYTFIRIDYTQKFNIEEHLKAAIESSEKIYLSRPEMYSWLDNHFPRGFIKQHTTISQANLMKTADRYYE